MFLETIPKKVIDYYTIDEDNKGAIISLKIKKKIEK